MKKLILIQSFTDEYQVDEEKIESYYLGTESVAFYNAGRKDSVLESAWPSREFKLYTYTEELIRANTAVVTNTIYDSLFDLQLPFSDVAFYDNLIRLYYMEYIPLLRIMIKSYIQETTEDILKRYVEHNIDLDMFSKEIKNLIIDFPNYLVNTAIESIVIYDSKKQPTLAMKIDKLLKQLDLTELMRRVNYDTPLVNYPFYDINDNKNHGFGSISTIDFYKLFSFDRIDLATLRDNSNLDGNEDNMSVDDCINQLLQSFISDYKSIHEFEEGELTLE